MTRIRSIRIVLSLSWLCSACTSATTPPTRLEPVTYAQFEAFVSATGYVTDAEKFGWSIVQQDVFNFSRVDSANWRRPDGTSSPRSKDLPVTQVSLNDALAYCAWSGTSLPSYTQYWELVRHDHRTVVAQNNLPISPADQVNVLGNVWDITSSRRGNEVRLAGGSLYCAPSMCNGTSQNRELYVDAQTGNVHIGFAVLR